jgi:hypothetical protein
MEKGKREKGKSKRVKVQEAVPLTFLFYPFPFSLSFCADLDALELDVERAHLVADVCAHRDMARIGCEPDEHIAAPL